MLDASARVRTPLQKFATIDGFWPQRPTRARTVRL
jgi:hypothetical protein